MFWQMVRVEHYKLTRRKILWVELICIAAAAVLIPLIIYLAANSDGSSGNLVITTDGPVEEMLSWPSALRLAIDLAGARGLGGLLVIVLTGSLTAQEYGWRTMQMWLSQGVSRAGLLLAKFSAVLLPALLLVVAPFISGALITGFFSQQLQNELPFAAVDWWQALASICRMAYTLLPFAALTFFLAVASRSTVVAIGGGLAYSLVIEAVFGQIATVAGGAWTTIDQHLPGKLAGSLTALNRVTAEAGTLQATVPEGVTPQTAVLGLALYTICFVGLAWLVFRRQDFSG